MQDKRTFPYTPPLNRPGRPKSASGAGIISFLEPPGNPFLDGLKNMTLAASGAGIGHPGRVGWGV